MADAPRYRRNPEVGETRIESDVFLVEPGTDEVFFLDATGAALWQLLSEPQTLFEIEAVFAAAFPDVPRDRLEGDLAALLAALAARKLVVAVE
jgi:hypothetical protein